MFKNLLKNDEAVSPIVATLVLIVVAIIGAAAVGLIMGTFSSNVAEETSAGDTAAAASTNVLIGGSTTVQPVSELLAEAFMAENTGVKITVQGGGSGVGIASVGKDIIDIGTSSRNLKTEETDLYPNLKDYVVGGSAVFVIVDDDAAAPTGATQAALIELYTAANDANNNGILGWNDDADDVMEAGEIVDETVGGSIPVKIYQRSDVSGTEETFAKEYLNNGGLLDASNAAGVSGNAAMVDAVDNGHAGGFALGFCDYGFTDDSDAIVAIGLSEEGSVTILTKPSSTNLKKTIAGVATAWPADLCRDLHYITNGAPSSVEQAFIDFAMGPQSIEYFNEAGMFSVVDIASTF